MFVIELWREPTKDGPSGSWRGIVKHVGHDEERYIAQLPDVTTFIARCLDGDVPAREADLKSDTIRTLD